ncbi:gamma-glutamyltransferase [uncultured Clostridium sp.]|uniref:gamma-glutamyltransferase n=1 Tax=uncultured Clostridium sp. TaxID=59620 RepID=UPI0028E2E9BB|nr:gamma-glutamyltransferase [uncultured Clostridium sp.]
MNKNSILKLTSLVSAMVLTMGLAACGNANTTKVDNSKPQVEEKNEEKPQVNMNRDARGKNGAVASAKPEASEVGVEIMKKGGNAIDAAIATAFALGVVEPNASGIGGGGFMLVRFAETGEEVFIDFRETAPGKATPDMYKLNDKGRPENNESVIGGKAIAIPGDVAGLLTALEKYGTMKREDVMQPAIDLAEKGFKVTPNFAGIITDNFETINKFEATKKIYLKDGLPYEEGDIIKNPDLAKTLKAIAKDGKDAFYKGEIAKAIVDEVQKQNGIITLEDLANYEVKMRKPVKGTYRGYEIVSAPPSSSGGTHIIQMLNMMENYDMKALGANTAESLHLWSEVSKLMFADRGKYMADTDFVKVPLAGLASKDYAKELTKKIDKEKSAENVMHGDPNKYESGSTTHFSVMDKEGNMVAVTKTINYFFGSGVTVPGTGIILNDEMDDFNVKPGTSNSIEPGKRPLSSMTPTLVLKDGKPFMVVGSPGATRIITTVSQVISNVIDHGMNIQDAINAPRMYDMNGNMAVEERVDPKAIEELEKKGHKVEVKGDLDPYFGGVQGIIMEASGELHGGGDPRRDGQAVAY